MPNLHAYHRPQNLDAALALLNRPGICTASPLPEARTSPPAWMGGWTRWWTCKRWDWMRCERKAGV